MGISNDDLVGHFLNEQARVNAALDEGDINIVIEDVFDIGLGGTEEIGFAAGESLVEFDYGAPPHHWDDPNAIYGFFLWL